MRKVRFPRHPAADFPDVNLARTVPDPVVHMVRHMPRKDANFTAAITPRNTGAFPRPSRTALLRCASVLRSRACFDSSSSADRGNRQFIQQPEPRGHSVPAALKFSGGDTRCRFGSERIRERRNCAGNVGTSVRWIIRPLPLPDLHV